jgi:uncharacterized membrane protein
MRGAILTVLLAAACAAPMSPPSPRQQPSAPDGQGPVVPQRLRAVGTEPFWAAIIDGATLTYMTPDDQRGARIEVRREDAAGAAAFTGVLAGRPLRLRVYPAQCSDGMSDRVYRYAAELDLGWERRRGCASTG